MKVSFRDVEHKLCIAIDARTVAIFNAMNQTDANALLCYGYIDRQAGLTFEVLGLLLYEDGDYTLADVNNEISLKVRAESFDETEIIPIENKALAKKFAQRIQIIEEGYYSHEEAEATRTHQCIDDFRNAHFPDDVLALLFKEGLRAEQIWVRLTGYIGNQDGEYELFHGRLLNQPFNSEFGVACGDMVIVIVSLATPEKMCLVLTETK